MKRFVLFFINKKPSINYLNKIKNSLFTNKISVSDSKYISEVKSHFRQNEIIEIKFINLLDKLDILFDNETFNLLIHKSFELANKIKPDYMPKYNNKYKEAIISTIESCLIKIKYNNKDIFYFCANIFFKLLVTHKLINGNKRIATSILINFLYYFGYYFKFQKDEYKNYRDWEKRSIEFIARSSRKENDDDIIKDIRNWIIKNLVIAYHFR